MGIFELAQSGSDLSRQTLSITTTAPIGSGSVVGFDYSYILLNVSADAPCRVRLYSDSSSVALDELRVSSSFDLNPATGLILDAGLDTSPLNLNFDPPIIGTTFPGGQTWYHISSSAAQTVRFTFYPIEFNTSSRQVISITGSGLLPDTGGTTGTVSSPKSFLILSASASSSGSRLRLYSRDISLVPFSERIRPFGSQSLAGSSLIVDMAFDSSSFEYKLVPTLEAYNLTAYENGSNFVGYILQNISSSPSLNVTASVYIYPIED
jgi:hypothetical protein